MIGKIIGKVTTNNFRFLVDGVAKKFGYVRIRHSNGEYVLGQIIEIEKNEDREVADCWILGFRENDRLKGLRRPLEPGSAVYRAEDDFVKETLGLNVIKHGAYFGNLEGRDKLKIYIDLNKILTKHLCVLAKSGSGKSYSVGVLLEELLERKVPVVVIDPHGEYSTLKYPNNNEDERLKKFDIKAKGYLERIQEFSPNINDNPEAKPLKLSSKNLEPREILHLLPAKLSNAQMGILYSAIKQLDKVDLDNLIFALDTEEGSMKWTLINIVEYLKKLDLFSENGTGLNEIVKNGKLSIINLRGVAHEVQEVIVYKLLHDLFTERKKGNIQPFFLVIEEAQNYCPERGFGEAKSSSILRQIASEGRKFGLGLCVVSQRPSRLDKSVISQCGTQIILKVTNPNDVKAISNSVEGITLETEKEIVNLPIGSAMLTGIVDMPLFVDVRPRKSKHGGEAINILEAEDVVEEEDKEFDEHVEEFKEQGDTLALVKQKTSLKDYKIMNDVKDVKVNLLPCVMFSCNDNVEDFQILINLNNGEIVTDAEKGNGIGLIRKMDLQGQQANLFSMAMQMKEFTAAELFAKSQVQFSEVYDIVNILLKKGYFVKEGSKFNINRVYDIFNKLKDYRSFEKVEYGKLNDYEKIEKRFNLKDFEASLGNYVKINNIKECWLVVYSKI